jgi:subtilisin family serine protease
LIDHLSKKHVIIICAFVIALLGVVVLASRGPTEPEQPQSEGEFAEYEKRKEEQQRRIREKEENDPSITTSTVTAPNLHAKEEFIKANDIKPEEIEAIYGTSLSFVVKRRSTELEIPKDSGVVVEPNGRASPQRISTDPQAGAPGSWYINKINLPAGWDTTTGRESIKIAVIDTGVDMDHEDLRSRYVDPRDVVDDDDDPSPCDDHGTSVAGTIGMVANNRVGSTGVMWDLKIIPIKAASPNDEGRCTFDHSDITSAIYYAIEKGAKVINLSLGGASDSRARADAIATAIRSGVTVIAAAGNCGDPASWEANHCEELNQISYPAANDGVIAVGATTPTDTRAVFSTVNDSVDISAPGDGMFSASIDGYTDAWRGTSAAAPVVSGVAGLIVANNSSITPSAVQETLINSAFQVPGMAGADRTNEFGFGRVDAGAALPPPGTPPPGGGGGGGGCTCILDEIRQRTSYLKSLLVTLNHRFYKGR